MYMTSTLKRGLIVVGASALAVVGLIAWTHRNEAPATAYANPANPEPVANYATYGQPLNSYGQPVNSTYAQPANNYAYGQPAPGYCAPGCAPASSYSYADRSATYGQRVYDQPPVAYGVSPFGSYERDRVVERVETQPPPVIETAVPARRTVVERRYYYSNGRRHYRVVRRRPFSHSAAIVGGSAAGGALIGALAGGGKGAAIGALAGGGAGLVYDRITHKKVVEH
jgi:hypothetical protein